MKLCLILLIVLIAGCATTKTTQPNPFSAPHKEPKPIIFSPPNKVNVVRNWLIYSGVHYEYPVHASARGIFGCVKIEYTIEIDGSVSNPIILASFPSSVFNRDALKAISSFKFVPENENTEIKPVRDTYTFNYSLSTNEGSKNHEALLKSNERQRGH